MTEQDTEQSTATEAGTAAGHVPWPMRARPFGAFLVVTGAVGLVASFDLILGWLRLLEDPRSTMGCDISPFVSCTAVSKQWQAQLFGFPNPLIGVAGFLVPITIGMALLSGARPGRWFWLGWQAGITAAAALVTWFYTQAVYAINALCPWCMVVWSMIIPMFVVTTIRTVGTGVFGGGPSPAGHPRAAALAGWWWVVVLVWYLVLAGTILVHFWDGFVAMAR